MLTYNEFLDLISNGVQLFVNGFVMVASSLITNYIFITLLGMVLFSSLLFLFIDNIVLKPMYNVKDNVDKWVDYKRNYVLYNDVRLNFLKTHSIDAYNVKMEDLKLNRNVFDNYLSNYKDLEFSIKSKQLENSNDVYRHIKSTNKNDEDIFNRWEHVLSSNERVITEEEKKQLDDIIKNF